MNYTNTFIINSAIDTKSQLAKWSSQAEQDGKPANFDVKRCGHFTKNNVRSIWKTPYNAGTKGKLTITMKKGTFGVGGSGNGSYQVLVWVMLSGATAPQDSRYANDFVEKGKPYAFSIEVTDSMATTDMATAFADQINRMSQEYDDYELVATAIGSDLVIKHGEADMAYYLKFTKGQLMQFNETAENPVRKDYTLVQNGVTVEPVEPFGTYDHLIRTISLPTFANRAWLNPNEEQQPIVGGHYNQYTIEMQEEVGVQGMSHMGQVVEARTTHVFYVLDTIASSFESALSQVGEIKDSTETYALSTFAGRSRSKKSTEIETEEAPATNEEKTE